MNSLENRGNIDGRQRRLRLLNGILLGAGDLALAAWIVGTERPWWWLFFLLPLHLGAALGILQARASTCVLLASRGSCHLGGRADRIEDPELKEALRLRGRSIARRAYLIAAAITALSIVAIKLR